MNTIAKIRYDNGYFLSIIRLPLELNKDYEAVLFDNDNEIVGLYRTNHYENIAGLLTSSLEEVKHIMNDKED